jgi:hypothetical protein
MYSIFQNRSEIKAYLTQEQFERQGKLSPRREKPKLPPNLWQDPYEKELRKDKLNRTQQKFALRSEDRVESFYHKLEMRKDALQSKLHVCNS